MSSAVGHEIVRVSVLGAVRVFRDGREVDLSASRPRLILALLVANIDRIVTVDELIDQVWGEKPPVGARNVLHRHIGRIRRALEPGLAFREPGTWLLGVPGGYQFRSEGLDVDLLEFRNLAARGSVAGLTAALRLWSGDFADGLDRTPTPRPTVFAQIEDERLRAAIAAADAAPHERAEAEVLPLVQAVALRHPLDDALAARTVGLLAATGKHGEALAWADRTADLLRDELGLEPGSELSAAQADLSAGPAGPGHQRPAQLPAVSRFFGGRAVEERLLDAALQRGAGVVAISGIPGVGKSALAVHWAHEVAGRFPGGQLFANLRGFDPGGSVASAEDVLGDFLFGLGVGPDSVPAGEQARAGLFRTLTAEQRILIVLDNARDAEQILPLLPTSRDSLVVVTSRARLSGLAARTGAELIDLDLPSAAEARENLRLRLGGTAPDEHLDAIVAHCGRLPLALALVAARAAGRPDELAAVRAELAGAQRGLEAFDDDVRSVFHWSYRQLSPGASRLFRLLSEHPGPDAGLPALASLAGIAPREAARLVRELVRTGLFTEHRLRRYVVHDLVRTYAIELAEEWESPAARAEAAARVLDHYAQGVFCTLAVFRSVIELPIGPPLPGVTPELPDASHAGQWFATEAENIEAVLLAAYRQGHNPWPEAVRMTQPLNIQGRYRAWRSIAEAGLAASVAAGDALAEAHMRRMLAGTLKLDDEPATVRELSLARDIFAACGDEQGLAATHFNLGVVYIREGDDGDHDTAIASFRQAETYYRKLGLAHGLSRSRSKLGLCLLRQGRADDGIAVLTENLAAPASLGGDLVRAYAYDDLGNGLAAIGRLPEAVDALLAARDLYNRVSPTPRIVVYTNLRLAEAYLRLGRSDEARGAAALLDRYQSQGWALDWPDFAGRHARLVAGLNTEASRPT